MTVPTTPSAPLEGEVLPRAIQVGERMRNGAIVLSIKPYVLGTMRSGIIVLALSHRDFVTWVCEADGSEAFWGHYHGIDIVSALADFEKRS